jgi:hypothetical protein
MFRLSARTGSVLALITLFSLVNGHAPDPAAIATTGSGHVPILS